MPIPDPKLQTHYMSCPRAGCAVQFVDRHANKASLRAAVQKHIAEVHENIHASCPTCQAVFDKGPNRRANENSLKEHMQVGGIQTSTNPHCCFDC